MLRTLVVLACLALLGCRVQEPDGTMARATPGPEVASPSPPPHDSTAPVVLMVEGPSTVVDGQEIVLRVRLDRRPAQVDVHVRVSPPVGVSSIGMPLEWTFGSAEGPTPERRVRLRVGKVPPKDLVVEAEAKGTEWGLHAKRFYRFGRPEPMLPDPGPSLTP